MSHPGKWRRRIGDNNKYTTTDGEVVNLFPSSKAVDLFPTFKNHSSSVMTRPMATTYTTVESRLSQSNLRPESVTVDGQNSGKEKLGNNSNSSLNAESVTVDGLNSGKHRLENSKTLDLEAES